MGAPPKSIVPVKLFCGVLMSACTDAAPLWHALEERWGPIDYRSPEMDFNVYSHYYDQEMGPGIRRMFVGFQSLIDRTSLPDIKNATIDLESKFAVSGKRMVNLDPGYLSLGQLFLASTKDNFCRIYLRDRIFAEVTLRFVGKSYAPFSYTYKDYASPEYLACFNALRALYKTQLQALA